MSVALRVASCMAENAMPFARALAAWLGGRLGAAVEFVEDVPWQEREQALYRGEIDLCWICGLPYARRRDAGVALEPLAAAVPAHRRYAGRAAYFSDVVVRADFPARRFDDLRAARWVFNEPNSHSGYNALLAALGSVPSRLEPAGSHQHALARVLDGSADAAAIDSTVLETELRVSPGLASRLRAVASLGPSPAPPWVARTSLPAGLRAAISDALVTMHETDEGAEILAAAGLRRLAAVTDTDYDAIRALDVRARAAA